MNPNVVSPISSRPVGSSTKSARWAALWILALATILAGCSGDFGKSQGNVLAGLAPTKVSEVARAAVITDGTAARSGDDWMTELTAHFTSLGSFVEYDLGSPSSFTAAYLAGDNDDEYVVSVSDDGVQFAPLWVAPSRQDRGQQARTADDLHGSGRYVRIAPSRGDGHFSLSEVQLFAERPAEFPPRIPTRRGIEIGESVRGWVLALSAAILIFLFATSRAAGKFAPFAAAIPVALAFGRFAPLFRSAFPLAPLDISLIRSAVAGVAAIAVWGSIFLLPRFRPARRALIGVLGLCGAVAVAAFFNLGHPQFADRSTGHASYIHNYDMRVYFPIAKYFEEIGFDGVYVASVAAYADDGAGATLQSLSATPIRDMDTLNMMRVGDLDAKIRAVQSRFSPERWQEFKRDMRYFRQTMGPADYLSSITDHGGNATPVWFMFARLLFFWTHADNATLFAAAMLDPLLLLLMFLAIGKAYGTRTALLTMIVFGANDFYMYGSNWAGATLRHDWLAFLGIGIAALKLERWAAGGAFIALAAMIRAFPALALFGAVMPIGWALWDEQRSDTAVKGAMNRFRALLASLRARPDFVRMFIGATACVVVLGLISSFIFSFGAWSDWLRKVAALDHDPSTNETSLRAFIAGTGGDQQAILRARWPIYALSLAVPSLAVIVSARGRRPDQIAVLALLLVPIVFNPANYYLHFVCLLPLVSDDLLPKGDDERWMTLRDAGNWLAILIVCVAQYWTVLEKDDTLHFRFQTVLYFAAMAHFLFSATFKNGAHSAAPEPAAT